MVGHSSKHHGGECKSQLRDNSHTRYKGVFQKKSMEKFDFDTVSRYLPTDPHLGQDMPLYFVNIYNHISIRKWQTTKYFRIIVKISNKSGKSKEMVSAFIDLP